MTEVSMTTTEFDQYADEYYQLHARNIAMSGESPEFFHRYKVADTRRLADSAGVAVGSILDFGCGIGNSIPYFREYFPKTKLFCADASARSLEIADKQFPGDEVKILVHPSTPIDLPDAQIDLCFAACVFHHIDHKAHLFWLGELKRVVRPGGLLVVFEHNPYNPLTRRAVHACPLDVNARLVRPRDLARPMIAAGWPPPAIEYRIFFPAFLARLRPLERCLVRTPLGAQYSLHAIKRDGR
jgi:SAM-dependent methyltransferase